MRKKTQEIVQAATGLDKITELKRRRLALNTANDNTI
jgi:hypothetical protein